MAAARSSQSPEAGNARRQAVRIAISRSPDATAL